MNRTCLVIGGCRSGKSAHALALAEDLPGDRRLFVATCRPGDDEMQRRVARHRRERGPQWATLEEPLALAEALRTESRRRDVILVDCLTLWISNLLADEVDEDTVRARATDLSRVLAAVSCPVLLVTNEVGAGIVPENALARLFRDCVGFANQRLAAAVDRVVWMVAGIPVTIKGESP